MKFLDGASGVIDYVQPHRTKITPLLATVTDQTNVVQKPGPENILISDRTKKPRIKIRAVTVRRSLSKGNVLFKNSCIKICVPA